MMRICVSLAALGAAVALAGCNEATGGVTAGPVLSAPAPLAMNLPAGMACSHEIGQYETVVKSDLATGNVEQVVYDKIQIEMAHAASACAAGRGGEAHALVVSSKASHGYRA